MSDGRGQRQGLLARRRERRRAQHRRVAELEAGAASVMARGGPEAEQLLDDLHPGRDDPAAARFGTVAAALAGTLATAGLVVVAVRAVTG